MFISEMTPLFNVIQKYQNLLLEKDKSDFKFSNKKPTFGKLGVANRIFILTLSRNRDMLLEFLRESGLFKSSAKCSKCCSEMKFSTREDTSEGYNWVCNKTFNGKACKEGKSIRYGSFFSNSRVRIDEILLLTYEIMRGTSSASIKEEYFFSSNTLANWRHFINKKIFDYMTENSEVVGGIGKIVDLNESKVGKRKYNNDQIVEGQWVMGGMERETGRFFLVAVSDKSEETMISVIKHWIAPGTSIHFDCRSSYNSLSKKAVEHLSVEHSVSVLDITMGWQTKTIQSTLKQVKSTLPAYNRNADYTFQMAFYMFQKACSERKVDAFNLFLEFMRELNWEDSMFTERLDKKIECE